MKTYPWDFPKTLKVPGTVVYGEHLTYNYLMWLQERLPSAGCFWELHTARARH